MILADNQDIYVARHDLNPKHRLSLLSEVYVERGTIDDWNLLHELHYKATNTGIGPVIYRATMKGETIGVGVMTVPRILSAGRNQIFKHLKPNQNGMDTRMINQHRVNWQNDNSCVNARLVLDTMYRGAGIAYRMQNIMMRMTGCRFVEFQSSMSKYNPFAARAGILFTKPKRQANYDKGVEFFRRWFRSAPSDHVGVMSELGAFAPAIREKCIAEMRGLYYRCSAMEKSGDNRMNGTSRVDGMEVGYLVSSLQQLTLASPLFGIYLNPDHNRELPPRIPLLAFDNQTTDEQLKLDWIH